MPLTPTFLTRYAIRLAAAAAAVAVLTGCGSAETPGSPAAGAGGQQAGGQPAESQPDTGKAGAAQGGTQGGSLPCDLVSAEEVGQAFGATDATSHPAGNESQECWYAALNSKIDVRARPGKDRDQRGKLVRKLPEVAPGATLISIGYVQAVVIPRSKGPFVVELKTTGDLNEDPKYAPALIKVAGLFAQRLS